MNTKRFVLTLLVATAAFIAVAQERERTVEPKGELRSQGLPGPMRMLDLTKEQQSKVEDIHLKAMREAEPLRAEMQKQHAALKLELTAEKYNESKVKSVQSEISRLQSELGSKRFATMRAVRETLTPEQQKKFDMQVLSNDGPRGEGPGRGMMHGQMHGPVRDGARGGFNGVQRGPGMRGRF
jgi:Spy/CpxP family protein refolding chaperone